MISARLPRIRTWITSHVRMEKVQPLMKILARLRRGIGGWVGAQFRLAGVTLGILMAGLLFLRVPHGILLAFAISLVDAFPVLGTGTVLLPWALILWLQGDSARAVGVLGIYAIISVTRSVLEPKLVGRQLGLDPLITLFALYAGFKLWGLVGMILSPMLAVTVMQLLPETRKK
jgi:predicted PurR-regulated permease PerM